MRRMIICCASAYSLFRLGKLRDWGLKDGLLDKVVLERKSSLGKKKEEILAGIKVLTLEEIHTDKCWRKCIHLSQ